jgi:hypothetical protein
MRESPSADGIEELERFLGPATAQYSDIQLKQPHRDLCEMAKLLLDIYRARHGLPPGFERE